MGTGLHDPEGGPVEPENGSWVQVAGVVYERDDIARHYGNEENWFNMNKGTDSYVWPALVDLARTLDSDMWLMGMAPVEEIKL